MADPSDTDPSARREMEHIPANLTIVVRIPALVVAVASPLFSICADAHSAPAQHVDNARASLNSSASQLAHKLKPEAQPSDALFNSRRIEAVGTLLLDDIMPLVRQAPRLKDEVGSALRQANVKAQDVICIGRRIDGTWKHLAGARVQPYVCKIGERWLEITAELRISGARGERYSTVSDIAAQNARTIKETKPHWNWVSIKPRDWLLE